MKNMKKVAEVAGMRTFWAAVALGVTLGAGVALAADAVQEEIAYEGRLADPVEGALEGTQTVTFRIFEESSGGKALWEKQMEVQCGPQGRFHVVLAAETDGALLKVFEEGGRFLELEVAGHGEAIAPRVEFASSPQVLAAEYAEQSPLSFYIDGELSASKVEVALTKDELMGYGAIVSGELSAKSVSAGGGLQMEEAAATVGGTAKAGKFEGAAVAPVGTILMWTKSSLPDGWALCDGTTVNGIQTPDLRGRFVVGAGASGYDLGSIGGQDGVTLTVDQIPSHSHSYEVSSNKKSLHGSESSDSSGNDRWWKGTSSGTTDSAGNSEAHENRPPYYALTYIMRVQ